MASKVTPEGLKAAQPEIARHALKAKLEGREVAEWASELLALAESGLQRLGNLSAAGEDETIYLKPIRALVDQGKCPADVLREQVKTPTVDALADAGVVYG